MLLLLLATLVGTGGCTQRYIITKTDGTRLITANKPKLVESKYVYRDASGRQVEVPTMRVRLIEPYSKKAAGLPREVPDVLR